MGCFPACFGASKRKVTMEKCHCCDKSHQNQSLSLSCQVNKARVKLLAASMESQRDEEIVNPNSVSEQKSEGQHDAINNEQDSSSIEMHMEGPISVPDANMVLENKFGEVKKKSEEGKHEGLDSNLPSVETHPVDHAHKDVLISNEECIVLNSQPCTLDNDFELKCTRGSCVEQEESSESLFSLSIDSRRQCSAAELEGDKEVMSPFKQSRPIDRETNSVGDKKNPPFEYEDKENVNLEGNQKMLSSEEVTVKQSVNSSMDNVIAVDTSLSSWLVESKKSLHKTTNILDSPESEKNYGDRRILGEVTPLELKWLIKQSSSAQSMPSCGAGDHSGVGTVGGKNTCSNVDAACREI